ncbi:MAG: CARDB domain-containing protein [Thermoplasmatota archaeon]
MILVIAPLFVFTQGSADQPLVPDPQFDTSAGVDVPTWRVGDYWNYTTSFSVTYIGFQIPFTGWMNMSVSYVSLDFSYSNSPVYITNITGNITGKLKVVPIIDETIYLNITGYMWNRIQDLSVYRMVTNASVSGTMSSINGNYPFGYEYFPPLEEYDFPLIPGETWDVNVSARVPFGGSGDIVDLAYRARCDPVETKVVPAGSFQSYPVSLDGTPALWFNDTVGNTVERSYSMDISGIKATAPFELREYRRAPEETRIEIKVETEQPVWRGATFTVSGELSVGNTMVTLLFPGGSVAANIPLTGSTTTFSRTLTAPLFPDDTPTDFDYGSFGILAVVGLLDEYDVCTITTKGIDLMINDTMLRVTSTGEGTIDDIFTINATVYNPSNYGAEDFSVFLLIEGNENTTQVHEHDLSLEAKGYLFLEYELEKDIPGEYSVKIMVDFMEEIDEYNETNNVANTSFEVLARPPLRWNLSPPQGDHEVKEGEMFNLSARATRKGETLPTGNWTIDGTEVDWDNELNLTFAYLGELSSRVEPYRIVYNLNPAYVFDDEVQSLYWNVTVEEVNRPPVLGSYAPISENVTINEGEGVNFTVEAVDPDGDPVVIEWYVNGILQPVVGSSFNLSTEYTGYNSSSGSPFLITVIAGDGWGPQYRVNMTWTVDVLNVDRLPELSVSPPPGLLEVEWNGSVELMVSIHDPDDDPYTISWLLNGTLVGKDSEYAFVPADLGLMGGELRNLTLLVEGPGTNSTFYWDISIIPPLQPPDDDEEPVPPAGVTIVTPVQGHEYTEGDKILIKAVHADARPMNFTWTLNGKEYHGDEIEVKDLSTGNYTLFLNASTEGPPRGWVELQVDFSVKEKEELPEEPQGGTEDEFPWWVIAVVVVAFLMGLGIALLFLRRPRKTELWEE